MGMLRAPQSGPGSWQACRGGLGCKGPSGPGSCRCQPHLFILLPLLAVGLWKLGSHTASLTLKCSTDSCFPAFVCAVPSTLTPFPLIKPVETLLVPPPLEHRPQSHHQLSPLRPF